jgi:hypothetical protein
MATKEKRNFRLKMNMATGSDDLRPVMQHVYFENGFMVATDAHILIKAAVHHFSDFDQSEVDILNGKFIHKNTFKKILSAPMVQITEEGVVDLATKDVYKFAEECGKYPNFEAVIPKSTGAIEQIGVTPAVVQKLFKILASANIHTASMNFEAANRGVVIKGRHEHEGALTALFMPAALID